jgi:Spy/CpxP family protein refolding chaperone
MSRLGLVALLAFTVAAAPERSLDSATIEALQKGTGNGMALVGELNHYPGPRHVLAMAAQLDMTDKQKAQTEAIYSRMHAAAVPLGLQIIEDERRLDRAFKDGSISDESLHDLTAQIATLNGHLRYIHLRAHLAMKHVLTAAQIRMYDSIRGYDAAMPGMQH